MTVATDAYNVWVRETQQDPNFCTDDLLVDLREKKKEAGQQGHTGQAEAVKMAPQDEDSLTVFLRTLTANGF